MRHSCPAKYPTTLPAVTAWQLPTASAKELLSDRTIQATSKHTKASCMCFNRLSITTLQCLKLGYRVLLIRHWDMLSGHLHSPRCEVNLILMEWSIARHTYYHRSKTADLALTTALLIKILQLPYWRTKSIQKVPYQPKIVT